MIIRELIEKMIDKDHFPDDIDAYMEDYIPNKLVKSNTLQEAYEVSDDSMALLYEEGLRCYESENYQDGALAFKWLALLNPFIDAYWMGLGASQQLLGEYEKALKSYAVAAHLEGDNPMPHLHAFDCLVPWANMKRLSGRLNSPLRVPPTTLK